jgi:hypothetical protein
LARLLGLTCLPTAIAYFAVGQDSRTIHFMTIQTQTQNRTETAERSSNADTVVGFAVLGLLVAGGVGVLKALSMDNGFDVLLCLLSSVAAFGAVYHIYFGKR